MIAPVIDIGSTLVERYELRARLGRGGMGEVYRAWDHELERDVAIKSLLPHLAAEPELVSRFRREARALARLRHHGIIALYDILRVPPDQLYLVLEYVPGEPLDRLMARGSMPWSRCARIGAEVCEALEAAHTEGVVHRDIKPSNILVEAGDRARVADFGLARLAGGAAAAGSTMTTRTGVVMGTPGYWAPEQALGRTITAQTDLYALGAVLFEAATGRLPHVAEDDSPAAAFIHIALPVPDPREVAPHLPDAAAEALMRALAKDPEDRFASGSEMAAALRASIGVRATRPAAPETEISPTAAPVALLSDPAVPPAPTIGPDSPIPGPWTPPPGTLVAVSPDAQTEHRDRLSRRGGRTTVLAIAALSIAAAVAGWLVGGRESSTTVAGDQVLAAAGLSISVPSGWTTAAPEKPAGLVFSSSAGRSDGTASITVGLIDSTKPTLLPAGLRSRLSDTPVGKVVALGGGVEALRYRGLAPRGLVPGSTLDLTAVPTSIGTAAVACVAPRGDGMRTCDAATASLTIANADVVALGPDAGYADSLEKILTAFSTGRKTTRAALAQQTLPRQQWEAARRVAGVYGTAARRLAAVAPADAGELAAHTRLVDALREVAGGYEQMAAATEAQQPVQFAAAVERVTRREIGVSEALRGFRALGYDIG